VNNATTSGAIDFASTTSKSESQYGLLHERFVAGVTGVEKGGVVQSVDSAIVDAVFAHIQAMRKLGHDMLNSHQIARALAITPLDVERALAELKARGVKVQNR
jgi:hypothetical protein